MEWTIIYHSPALVQHPLWLKKKFLLALVDKRNKCQGAVRELNPRPPAPKAGIIPLDQRPLNKLILKNMLDGIRTRNPQIRSLMRYPLRHEHLTLRHTDRPKQA